MNNKLRNITLITIACIFSFLAGWLLLSSETYTVEFKDKLIERLYVVAPEDAHITFDEVRQKTFYCLTAYDRYVCMDRDIYNSESLWGPAK